MKSLLERERDQWPQFAKAWSCANDRDGLYSVGFACGLCPMVDSVRSDRLRLSMQVRLSRYLPQRLWKGTRFRWSPHTLAGRNARVRFCKRMARLCEKEMQCSSKSSPRTSARR